MANVRLGTGESFESLLRRFNRQVQESRVLAEVRHRRYYIKPSVERNRKEAARKRKTARPVK